ncbi:hypothetical protein CGRA01v4_01066 [Colletotrichum graminicola]|nr:hypothetical protein CGRA01v4_01066 [Colletotrichum graminicola]
MGSARRQGKINEEGKRRENAKKNAGSSSN